MPVMAIKHGTRKTLWELTTPPNCDETPSVSNITRFHPLCGFHEAGVLLLLLHLLHPSSVPSHQSHVRACSSDLSASNGGAAPSRRPSMQSRKISKWVTPSVEVTVAVIHSRRFLLSLGRTEGWQLNPTSRVLAMHTSVDYLLRGLVSDSLFVRLMWDCSCACGSRRVWWISVCSPPYKTCHPNIRHPTIPSGFFRLLFILSSPPRPR